ncbi:MAG: DUF1579 family protein [Rhodothermales bacterium]|nr:DUF1579 family protein [Rhodothermales bacterium]
MPATDVLAATTQSPHGIHRRLLLTLMLAVLACGETAVGQTAETPRDDVGISWLLENFSGPFQWTTTDPSTGEDISGTGHCEPVFGDGFLRCVHRSPSGEEIGVGISGYHEAKRMYQWAYYGADGSAIMFGEGQRDPVQGISWVEGRQKIEGLPEFTFRTVTRELSDGEWSYTHYRVDGDTLTEMFNATFIYPTN